MTEFSNATRLSAAGLAAACLLALTACTGAGVAAAPTRTAAADGAGAGGSGALPGYRQATKDQLSPLIITTLAPAPIPVKGSDNEFHVAYELSVFNDAPRDATMTKVETIAGNDRGKVIATMDQEQVAAHTMLTGDLSLAMLGSTDIPAGRTAIIVFRDVYPTKKSIPATFTHRISATFAPPKPDQAQFAAQYPGQVSQIGGAVTVSTHSPVVIGPPLLGDDWVAFNGLNSQSLNPHSLALLPIGGRINGAERFAVDFIRIDPKAAKGTDPPQGTHSGDPSRNTSYYAFDQPVIAVANAKVVTVVSDRPDGTPNPVTLPESPVDQLEGNEVTLDLGHGIYATYAHLKQGPAEVRVGETVKKGQEIGRLGDSGNSTEAHLHFQLQAGPLPMTSDNVPWVIDTFTAAGTLGPGGVVKTPTPGPRTDELPVGDSISNFAAPSR